MSIKLKYPIATDKTTRLLVNAKDTLNGKDCNCFCQLCGEDLISYNNGNIQRPHFKHQPYSDCYANYETYIHWLSKEVFKEIKTIDLPNLGIADLGITRNTRLLELYELYKIQSDFQERLNTEQLERANTRLKNVTINSVEIEKLIETPNGSIQVDVALKIGNRQLFVEPYYSNPIDIVKRGKIISKNISTISISLLDFIINNNHYYFTKQDLIDFIKNNQSGKKWEYRKSESLITEDDFKKIELRISQNKDSLKLIGELTNQKQDVLKKMAQFYSLIKQLEIEEDNLTKEIKKVKFV